MGKAGKRAVRSMKRRRPKQHVRKYRRGKKVINRGIKYSKKTRRASKLRRDMIRKQLKATGPYKERIVRIMEKDPLLWRDYQDVGRPKIRMDPSLLNKKRLLGQKLTERQYADIFKLKWPKKEHWVKLDPKVFKEGHTTYRKHLGTRMSASPRKVLQHEIAHAKYDDLFKKRPDLIFHNMDEELADYRADFDIRKVRLPKSDEGTRNEILFKRLSTWEK